MLTPSGAPHDSMITDPAGRDRFTLWIDGVGAYQLYLTDSVTIGGPVHAPGDADICLLANLSRRHATLARSQSGYWLEAHSAVRVAERPVEQRTHLNDGYVIELGQGVRLRFRLPSVLSATATLEFVSDHRPSQSIDGIVLMDETCLMGAASGNHIHCPDWAETVLLFRKDGQFWCKSHSDLFVDGRLNREGGPIAPGNVVSGLDATFRIEASK